MMPDPMPLSQMPPDLAAITALAEHALATIPAKLRALLPNISIAVEEMPDDETLAAMGIDNAWELTGLYHGTPLPQRSVDDIARPPDQVTLYRQPILLEWIETAVDLADLVRTVLIHEIAHHFGFSDAEIEVLEERGKD